MDRGAWQATSMGSQSQTQLSTHTTHTPQKAQVLVNLGGQRVRGVYSFWLCSPHSLAKEEGAVVSWKFQEGKGNFLLGQGPPLQGRLPQREAWYSRGDFFCCCFLFLQEGYQGLFSGLWEWQGLERIISKCGGPAGWERASGDVSFWGKWGRAYASSKLQHVGSSSLTRDQTRTPGVGSMES